VKSKFSVFGHPIHPMLVPLPIGLFVWTLIANIVYVSGGRDMNWYDITFWSGVAAIIAAIGAALPGLGDYFTLAAKSRARDMATAHMVLNFAVTGLFIIAMLLMLNEGATSGAALTAVVGLHAVGVGIVALSAVLGGELVYRHHVAMVSDDAELERAEVAHHRTDAEAWRDAR
jgi:uncharacterized membrane protein